MSIQDPLGDMLTRIRNAQERGKSKVICPVSKLRGRVLEVLKHEGFIRDFATVQMGAAKAEFEIELKYFDGAPVIREIHRVRNRAGVYTPRWTHCPQSTMASVSRYFRRQRASCPTTRRGRKTSVGK